MTTTPLRAEAMREALILARDEIVDAREITDSYCELCEAHAPKDADGKIEGRITHRPTCVIAQIDAALSATPAGAPPVLETTRETRAKLTSHLEYNFAKGYASQSAIDLYAAVLRDFDKLLAYSSAARNELTPEEAAYGALWRLNTDNPFLHDARKALLTAVGGLRSKGQRRAIAWAIETFGHGEAPLTPNQLGHVYSPEEGDGK